MAASQEAGDKRPERGLGQPATQSGAPEEELPPIEGDFADEHTDVTFAEEQAGGPEGDKESESPAGYAGMDPGVTG